MKARRQQELEQMMAHELKAAQEAADHQAEMQAEAEAARERERVKMAKIKQAHILPKKKSCCVSV
jgi:hypothetical protein